MSMYRYSVWLLLTAIVLGAVGCKETPVDPEPQDDTYLEAGVDGTSMKFESVNGEYVISLNRSEISGTVVGTSPDPTKTLLVTFVYNLDERPVPETLGFPEVNISYVSTSPSDTLTYNCPFDGDFCTLTVESFDGDEDLVKGTFSATLVNTKDDADSVKITDGRFSAKLDRI